MLSLRGLREAVDRHQMRYGRRPTHLYVRPIDMKAILEQFEEHATYAGHRPDGPVFHWDSPLFCGIPLEARDDVLDGTVGTVDAFGNTDTITP